MDEREFEIGISYPRDDIFNKLGGCKQHYLPMKAGRVLYGAFKKDLNPDVPNIVLPGKGPVIKKSALAFASQEDPIPVFVKIGTNQWKYSGKYKVERVVKDPKVVEEQKRKTNRTDISMILYLDKVE